MTPPVSPARRGTLPAGVLAAGAGTGLVLVTAFSLSYAALMTVGQAAGFQGRIAWLYPIPVDGLLAVGMVAAVMLRSARLRTRAYVWLLIAGGIATSVLGNAAHATSQDGHLALSAGAARLAGGVPPLAFAAALHLLVILVRHSRAAAVTPVTVPMQPPTAVVTADETSNVPAVSLQVPMAPRPRPTSPRPAAPAASSDKAAEARRLRAEGVTPAAIARQLQTNVRNVHRWAPRTPSSVGPAADSPPVGPTGSTDDPAPSTLHAV